MNLYHNNENIESIEVMCSWIKKLDSLEQMLKMWNNKTLESMDVWDENAES